MDFIKIKITKGAIKNNYINVSKHLNFFPKESLGGKNKSSMGMELKFNFGKGLIIFSDIDSHKKNIRIRPKNFFSDWNIQENEMIIIKKIKNYEYNIRPYSLDLKPNIPDYERITRERPSKSIQERLKSKKELSDKKFLESFKKIEESKNTEFKSSFRYCYNRKANNEEIKLPVIKTINALFNTNGGQLFIGVDDDGKILGVEKDNYFNNDKFELAIRNEALKYMPVSAISKIDLDFISYNEKKIIKINVPKIHKTFMKWKLNGKLTERIYVRVGPSNERLLMSDFENHFR